MHRLSAVSLSSRILIFNNARITPVTFFCQRLTTQETSIALRPFFFAVHPDLFGQHPKERAVNEEAIKHLNEHLEKIRGRNKVSSIRLQFYVRKAPSSNAELSTKQCRLFERITITLQPSSVQDTVRQLLSSCSLPLDYVNSLQSSVAPAPRALGWKVKWEPSFYRFYGIPNPDGEEGNAQSLVTLTDWLKDNLPLACKNQDKTRPIRVEVERLEVELKSLTGVRMVKWDCGWGQTQYRTALRGLLRVCAKHSIKLTDETVIFGSKTGICCRGDILLRSDDVAENWLWVLRSSSRYDSMFYKLPPVELYLSTLLGGLQVTRAHQSPPLVQVYLQQVRRLATNVRDHLDRNSNQAVTLELGDLRLIVECMTGPLLISPSGEFRVPSSSPGFLVVDFLQKNVNTARQRHLVAESTRERMLALTQACTDRLGLQSLCAADNLTPDQYVSCLQKLLRDAATLPVNLNGCRLQIAHFYSLRSDGEICVPWNYESIRTTRR